MKFKHLNKRYFDPSLLVDNQRIEIVVPIAIKKQASYIFSKESHATKEEIKTFLKMLNHTKVDAFLFSTEDPVRKQMSCQRNGRKKTFFGYTVMKGENNPYINHIPTLCLAKRIALETNEIDNKYISTRIIVDIYWYENNSIINKTFKTLIFDKKINKWCTES